MNITIKLILAKFLGCLEICGFDNSRVPYSVTTLVTFAFTTVESLGQYSLS